MLKLDSFRFSHRSNTVLLPFTTVFTGFSAVLAYIVFAVAKTQPWFIKLRTGYIYDAVNGHRDTVFTAAVQLLDGAKPNTNPNPNTNLTVILILTLTNRIL